jgi:hypothetical protein
MKALNKCEKAMGYWELAYKLDLRKSSLLKEIENCRNH